MSEQRWIDLRSDTVTRPSANMRAAMASAVVGDDVYGEDPTVNELEARAAPMFGKEAAVFVPTGTMGNTIAVKMHTKHGEEVICDSRSHLVDWELSMMAWFSGCLARTIATDAGILDWRQIAGSIRRGGLHGAPTTLVCLENTHNMSGGTVYPQETIDEICTEAHALGIKVHMDGARVFNASVATGTPVARLAKHVDSLMFCLSKGLGAPVGSMVVGTAEDITQARLYRKRLGGGMRQAGVLAAAGLLALDEGVDRLADDHRNARYLAERIGRIPGISLRVDAVQTNIVIFDVSPLGLSAPEVSQRLKAEGILANAIDAKRLRMVTHCDVDRTDCERAADVLAAILAPQMAGIAVV